MDQTTNMNNMGNGSLPHGNGATISYTNDNTTVQMDIQVNNQFKTEAKRSIDETDEPSCKRMRTKGAIIKSNLILMIIQLHCSKMYNMHVDGLIEN